jgi:universal stress protein E
VHLCHAYVLGDREEVERRLRKLGEDAQVRAEHVHLECGEPADIIARCAQSLGADIVVMGAVSRSALERMLIGQTAEQVLDAVDCDVLVVKPPDFPQAA